METLPGAIDSAPAGVLDHDARSLPPAETRPSVPWRPSQWSDRTRRWVERGVDAAVVAIVVIFVLAQLGPSNLLRDTTPAGGDMGGHVWGPAYLRDHLLPNLRLTGWTPDWYGGFPAFQFYMVVPALLIVLLDVGLHGWAALIPLAFAAFLVGRALAAETGSLERRAFVSAATLVALLGAGLPYGVAFKLVTVLGVLAIPACAYAMGRLSGLPFPTPALLSMSMLVFLFNREPSGGGTGNIIGGNITSTLAGEYSFSIALAIALLFLGVLIHGLRTGRRRWLAAVLFALSITSHLIVGLFAAAAGLIAYLVWPGRKRLRVIVPVFVAGGLLSSFWTVPFVLRSAYVNDMGWEKSPASSIGKPWTAMLTDGAVRGEVFRNFLAPKPLYWIIALALVGFVVSIVLRIRFAWWIAITTFVMAAGFVLFPSARLWNARILPFYYLGLCLLAAVGVAELGRSLALLASSDPDKPNFGMTAGVPVLALAIVLVIVGLPLDVVPGQRSTAGGFALGPIRLTTAANPARDWARWNYSGYEEKAAYPEYRDFITTFARVGRERGCGRAMWEYEDARLNSYGTPMAPMLLPFWTDGCIGSMEGLYFESSTTTPFHFINQDELSSKCSCAQRNLPYGRRLDLDLGVKHMQLLGVRYYAASTPAAIAAASAQKDLTEVARSGPWRIYEVANSQLVEPLANQPAVLTAENGGIEWVYGTSDPHGSKRDASGAVIQANGPAMSWYLDPSRWSVLLAADGPSGWARVPPGQAPPARPEPSATVSSIRTTTDEISFDVDTLGVPVLVKASYFPNWAVQGADGPYRVTPNLMVVIPTSNHVRLYYGRTAVDIGGYLLALAGIVLVVWLARRGAVPVPEADPSSDIVLGQLLEEP